MHIMASLIKTITSVLKASTDISQIFLLVIYNVGLAEIVGIMPVLTFKIGVILYFYIIE